MFSEKSRLNSNCLRLPNGADFNHFHFPPVEIPPGLKSPGRPLIGYYGAIADWFDTKLVSSLALARPGWDFVLIGSTLFADLGPLKSLANLKLLGEMPYADLPQYLHAFDVAIIPFKRTPLTEATNPVKLFEYLSAGKPLVATDLSELHIYQDYVQLASTTQQWLETIEACLAEDSPQLGQKRMDFARQNTWQRRFEQLEPRLVSLFPAPASSSSPTTTWTSHGFAWRVYFRKRFTPITMSSWWIMLQTMVLPSILNRWLRSTPTLTSS